ncbi:MAG: FAD-dependent oxidoreductase [Gammaproteobacteria bacterium]|nr:MAG: FAD-dependent oxidoreductase [Gammaproteobacteria bacterium]
MSATADLPKTARVVIIGGGIIGCSTAYHLAKMGCSEVVLLEKHKLTSGSTFHAAGLVGQLRTNANITQLLGYSVELYKTLEQETGLATGWKMNGGLRLACNPERWIEVKRQATTAHSFGLEMHLLTPGEALELWPVMDISDLVGAAFLPTDGQANPSDITQSLASGARKGGVQICEGIEVTGFEFDGDTIRAVETDAGSIRCERAVICAGQWSQQLGRLAGINIPLVSVQHQYLVTEAIAGVAAELPTLRDPDRLTYFKEDVGGLVMGGYEPNPIPWAEDGIPPGFNFTLLDNNWDHFEPLMEQAIARVPALADAGVRQMFNGPESFTPDGNFILGEAPERNNVFVGAGFNAFGIASAGGAGMALAEWVVNGVPPFDLWPVDIRRFGQPHRDIEWVRQRTLEAYAKHYTMAWPFEENVTCRPSRRSPLYDTLKSNGACFGEKLGWERPNWFAEDPQAAHDEYGFGRQNWFDAVGREHAAARERVAIFDQSSFAKYRVSGADAERALSWICAGDVAVEAGRVVYTQLLNQQGGIECDLTVTRIAADEYYLVTGTGFATHDLDWIRRNIPAGLDARVDDVTTAWAVLSLMGPKSRDVLQALVRDDLSNQVSPFATMRELAVSGAKLRALRVSYVGELGWELHVPVESALSVYQALMAAGADAGIVNAGYRAIESLRLEKGYRAWGADIGPDYTPLEAGLGWAVDLKSGKDFIGRDAIVAQQGQPLTKSLACFTLDDCDVVLLGRETIYRNDERVGWLSSAGWGYTVGANIGFGYVRWADGIDRGFLESGRYELEVAGERVACEWQPGPLYDPVMQKMKC